MTAPGPRDYSPLPPPGSTVVDIYDVAVGRVAAVVPSPAGPPTWVTVTLAGTDTIVIAPLAGSDRTASGIVLGVDAAALRGAPRMANRTISLTDDDETAAANYYRRYTAALDRSSTPLGDMDPTVAPRDETGGDGSTAADSASVIRSREDLLVRTERYPYRRVRLRKRVITEERTITVTVRREEFVVEETDIEVSDIGPGTASSGFAHSRTSDAVLSAQHGVIEMTLYAEVPVIGTEIVAVERIRARVVDVDDRPVEVAENVRHEEVDVQRN